MSNTKALEPRSVEAAEDGANVLASALILSRLMGETVKSFLPPESKVTADRVVACLLLAVELCQQTEKEGGLQAGVDWKTAFHNAVDDAIATASALEAVGTSFATIEEDARKAAEAEEASKVPPSDAS